MSYKVKVTGEIYGHGKPEDEVLALIGDMLRYDSGDVVSVKFEPVKQWQKFTAIIHTEHYTKARWDSFVLKTEVVEQVTGPALPARFNSSDEVAQFSREKCER